MVVAMPPVVRAVATSNLPKPYAVENVTTVPSGTVAPVPRVTLAVTVTLLDKDALVAPPAKDRATEGAALLFGLATKDCDV